MSNGNARTSTQQNTGTSSGVNNAAAVTTSSAPSSHCYKVPILEDAEGYTHWHFCMKLVLEDCKLLSIVEGRLPKLDLNVDAAAHEDWMSKDLKARIQIASTL